MAQLEAVPSFPVGFYLGEGAIPHSCLHPSLSHPTAPQKRLGEGKKQREDGGKPKFSSPNPQMLHEEPFFVFISNSQHLLIPVPWCSQAVTSQRGVFPGKPTGSGWKSIPGDSLEVARDGCGALLGPAKVQAELQPRALLFQVSHTSGSAHPSQDSHRDHWRPIRDHL